jgi:hypothetical protein
MHLSLHQYYRFTTQSSHAYDSITGSDDLASRRSRPVHYTAVAH